MIGLATGLACVLLIGLWVEHELSYDDFHPDGDRTYRVLREFNLPDLNATISATPSALAPVLEADYPQAETAVRTRNAEHLVERGPRKHVEPGMLYADPGFFDIFGVEVQRGTARLQEPGTLLLTPSLADKYFPNAEPIGQTLRVNEKEMEVTGIAEPPPTNTHLDYSLVASLATRSPSPEEWGINNWSTYVRLQEGVSAATFEPTFEDIVRTHRGRQRLQESDSELPEDYHLQPVTGIHLGLGVQVDIPSEGNLTYVYLFLALALFVLLLACINFMNLATARAGERANEVGVRKAMGAGRGHLAGQFFGASVLTTALALVLAVGISVLTLPAFNTLAGTAFAASTLVDGSYLLAYVGLILIVGLIAGSYPALLLSGYHPVETLRSSVSSSTGSPRLRQTLVVFQFVISIALIAGTAVVHHQVEYLQTKDLGFEQKNVLVVNDETQSLQGQIDAFKQELERKTGVEVVASGFSVPGSFFLNTMWRLDRPDADRHNAYYSFVGYDYVETLEAEMVTGRDFSREHPSDTMGVVINEAAVSEFGFASPQDATGNTLARGSSQLPIIGVVANFHYQSLHSEINPLILMHEALRGPRYVAARIQPGQEDAAIDAARRTWDEFSALPFDYSFLANDLAAQYEAEQRVETLFALFAGLAILIACLGLFGLAAYAVRQRRQEIGIRKTLGATAERILALLSKEFLMLVGIAFVVAAPVAYLGLQRWLQNFAYRIDPGLGTFLLAGGTAFLIALLTVSTQALRAAWTDPATAIRQE